MAKPQKELLHPTTPGTIMVRCRETTLLKGRYGQIFIIGDAELTHRGQHSLEQNWSHSTQQRISYRKQDSICPQQTMTYLIINLRHRSALDAYLNFKDPKLQEILSFL